MRKLILMTLALALVCTAPSWGFSKAIVDLGNPDAGTNLTHPQGGDGDTTPTTMGGLVCRRNVDAVQDGFFYFCVADSWAYQASRPAVYITVHYYDTGTGSLALQYDGKSGAYTSAGSFAMTNTNTWKLHTWYVKDAYFGNRQNGSADFRIAGPSGSYFYLDLVYVRQFSTKVPSVRVVPRPGSSYSGQPFADMMNNLSQWPASRMMMMMLGYFDHTLNNRSDAELDAWMSQIPGWGSTFGLETGAVKDWGHTGQACYNAEHGMWDRFIAHGTTIDQFAMDEPLFCVRDNSIGDDNYAVTETVNFMSLVRANYPQRQIGDIEPYPSVNRTSLQWWVDALNNRCAAVGTEAIDFLCIDPDWRRFPGTGSWSDMKLVEDYCRNQNLPFSMTYWASPNGGGTNDADWYNDIMTEGTNYRNVGGKPDEYNVESWLPYIPSLAVPEGTSFTFTNSVRDFRQNYVGDNAQYVSDTIPTSMTPGQQVTVSITMKNTGTTTWNLPDSYKLGAIGNSDPFASSRQLLSTGDFIEPNQNKTFTFVMTAPMTPGTYTSDWQMLYEYLQWFGGTLVKAITVGSGGTNNAQFIGDTIPAKVVKNEQFGVVVTMKNTGTSTWTAANNYKLGGVGNSDPFYTPARVLLGAGDSIAQNQQKTFNFTMTAPSTAGTYTTDWRMLRENVEWFGDTDTKTVVVNDGVSENLGTTNVNNGMTCPSSGAGDNTPATQGGVDCRRNLDPNSDYYFFFTVSDSWAYQGSKPSIWIKVRYYDTGGGNILLQYDGTGGAYTSGGSVAVGTTNTWKTYVWHVTDAYFGNRENNSADFRLFLDTGQTRYIDTVEVSNSAL